MGFMMKVVVLVFLISFIVFVIFFGRLPALRKTPIGALHRLLWIHLPRRLISLDQKMTNGKIHAWSSRFIKHMMNDRHPTILIAFILLLFIPELMFLPKVVPTLSMTFQAMVTVIVLYPYLFLFLAAYVDPGYVSKARLDFYGSLYPYDHTLYLPNQICVTCRLPKPPRSKHCSVCGHCVARLDHHCVFINGCVGYGNQHWFLLLLFSTAILTSTGTWLGGMYCSHLITTVFPNFNLLGSGLSWSGYFSFWAWAMQKEPRVGSIALLCLLTTPLVWGLLIYSLYLVYRGTTTNESGKWNDFQLDIDDGFLYRRQLPQSRQRDSRSEPDVIGWPKSSSHIYIRAYDEPPSVTSELPGEGPWDRDFTLANVENIYDIGFVGGMFDVLFPRKYLMAYTGSADDFPE